MEHAILLARFRSKLSDLVRQVEMSSKAGHLDINKLSEDVVCGLLRELYQYDELRNLNADKQQNYPGIDLADDHARVAVQVTADRRLKKVTDTLQTAVNKSYFNSYDKFIICILTNKQDRYKNSAISQICDGKINFDPKTDIIDHRDIYTQATIAPPPRLKAAFDHLSAYLDGVDPGAGQANFQQIEGFRISAPDPTLADEQIVQQLNILRSSRPFSEFDRKGAARRLANDCTSGRLSSGSAQARSRALAWCARILSHLDIDAAEEAFNFAHSLSTSKEIELAEAFLISQKEGCEQALTFLQPRDYPSARSAALIIVANHNGKSATLDWFRDTGLHPNDLDPDGKSLLLQFQLEQAEWESARKTAESCSDTDYNDTPVLLLNVALEALLRIVPEEYRLLVSVQVPFQMGQVELSAGKHASEVLLDAQKKFSLATIRFRQLEMNSAAELSEAYELWLALSHPDLREDARSRLLSMLDNPAKSLRLIPHALSFGVKLDLDAVERAVNQQVALGQNPTPDAAVARLSLALIQPSPENGAAYIERYRDELEAHLDIRGIGFIEIQMLAKSGQREAAQTKFDNLKNSINLSYFEETRFRSIITNGTDQIPIDELRTQYEESNSLTDLKLIVDELARSHDWRQLQHYAMNLHQQTASVSSAEHLILAWLHCGQHQKALNLIEREPELLKHSNQLPMLRCWALYQSGRLIDAKRDLLKLSDADFSNNYHILARNIDIASGDWQSLSQLIGNELGYLDKRSPEELLQASYLGFQSGSTAAEKLLFEAVKKGNDDPQILASAYFLASQAGIEDNSTVSEWIVKAASLSTEAGPIQKKSLENILAIHHRWNDRQERTLALLKSGQIPIFIAAQSLNKPLMQMMLLPFLRNLQESDPRKRIPIYAFSGKRPPTEISSPKVIGLDVSALLTLSGLELLETLKSAPFKIRIAHSTLHWLFEERQRAAFHQPSLFTRAQVLQDLIVAGKLAALTPSAPIDSRLAAEIGDELAAMIAEAEDSSQDPQSKRKYVVRSFPVTRLGSLRSENADLTGKDHVLVSCQAVVDKLRSMGKLTSYEANQAQSYLQVNEQRWENEPEITDGSDLYLDSVSVSYLETCNLLEPLCNAGFTVSIHESLIEESRILLSFRRSSERLNQIIETLRAFLHEGIQLSTVIVDALIHTHDPDDENNVFNHPTAMMLSFSDECDVIVFDDRCMNQHLVTEYHGTVRNIVTSFEFLRLLERNDIISTSQYQEASTKLRRGGYLFTDIDQEDLFNAIERCESGKTGLTESAELRAIREAFLFARFSKALSYPNETAWLDRSIMTLLTVYRQVWKSESDLNDIKARAEWLLGLCDLRGWLSLFPARHANTILSDVYLRYVSILIFPPVDISEVRQASFLEWVDERVVTPLRQQHPDLFDQLIQIEKDIIISQIGRHLESDLGDTDD